MAKIIKQKERKALGLKNTAMEAMKFAVGDPKALLWNSSSVCTDGAQVNTGEKSGLWALLDGEMKAIGSEITLIKIWCAAHRVELVWIDTTEKFKEFRKVVSILSSISSYFHHSGLRTAELEGIAKQNGLTVLKLPKIFEIRWTNFTFTLVRCIHFSWEALVRYFGKNIRDSACAGFLRYLTNLENLHLIAFLGDVLYTYQRFQKNSQYIATWFHIDIFVFM